MKKLTTFLALCIAVAALATDDSQKLPSRDPATVIPLLKKLSGRPELRQVEEIVGRHDRETGSGRCIFIYVLQDKSVLSVNTGDCNHPDWITRRREGQMEEVIFQAKLEPNQPTGPTPPSGAAHQ